MSDEVEKEAKARKRMERLEQNRLSARESRKRKKTMIEELQRTVITLSRENKDLNERNEHLRRQLIDIGSKHPSIVPLQAIITGTQTSVGEASVQAGTAPPALVPTNIPAAPGQLPLPSLPVTENGTPVPLAHAQVPASWQTQMPQMETPALESTIADNGTVNGNTIVTDSSTGEQGKEPKQEHA